MVRYLRWTVFFLGNCTYRFSWISCRDKDGKSPVQRGEAMRIGFIGAGKVGFSLGKYFSLHGAEVAGYFSRSFESAEKAARFTGTAAYRDRSELIEACDMLFLTVPDGLIAPVFRELDKEEIRGKYICHSSGALTAAAAFPDIESAGAFGYSVHPLFAVSDAYHAYEELADVFFALEGSVEHLEEVRSFLTGTGLNVQVIDSGSKTRYHCAASIASNLVVALAYQSVSMLKGCGFTPEGAIKALTPLMRGNMNHILADGPVAALTGPVERADAGTVEKHLGCLTGPGERELYRLVSQKLVEVAEAKHPERDYSSVKKILETR